MGINGIGFSELLVILVVVLLLFGTKKLTSLGQDLGEAVRGFRKAMADDPPASAKPADLSTRTTPTDAD